MMIGGIPIECYVLENEQRVVVASGLANALDIKNSNSSQRRAITQLFRKLTLEIGHPELQKHLSGVTALMRAAESWEDFQRTLARAYPKLGEQHLLDVYRDFEGEHP